MPPREQGVTTVTSKSDADVTASAGSGGEPDTPVRAASRLSYLPAIDGLRTLALLAVLLDHAGVPFATGGFLGVTVFFVLSGFLVTTLLLQERHHTGRIDLRAFWSRRARRLVPASLAFFVFTIAYLRLSGDHPPSSVLGDGLAGLGWMANWRFVLTHRSYADLFADPTPFAHLWSLAVEEQFYVALPIVAFVALGRRRRARSGAFAATVGAVVVGSSALLWLRYSPNSDPLRPYYGTDTRIGELAVGVLLAIVLTKGGQLRTLPRRSLPWLSAAAVAALAVIGYLVTQLTTTSPTTFHGGLTAVAVLSAIVVVACTQRGPVAALLSIDPLPQLGRLTYSAYLFHWPVFLWLDDRTTDLPPPSLLALRLAVTFGLALTSYVLIEQPIRHRRMPRPIAGLAWADGSIAVAALLVLATAAPAGTTGGTQLAAGIGGISPAVPAGGASVTTTTARDRAGAVSPKAPGAPPAAAGPGGVGAAVARVGAPPSDRATALAPPVAAAPRAAPAPSKEATTTTVRSIDPDALRIAVVGDSLANNFGTGLLQWAKNRSDVVVTNLAVPACPISRGGTRRFSPQYEFPIAADCAWWDDDESDRLARLRSFKPDIVLVEDALNEIADRKLPEWPDYLAPGDPRFDAWLLNEYRTAAKVFSEDGALVVFANAPCADWERNPAWNSMSKPDQRVDALNRVYDNVVASTTKVADFFDRVCPDGKFTETVEGVDDARPDGFHLIDEASQRLAERWLAPFLRSADEQRARL
jgi:peptidoglycan/LPS O-acetylase OafA/YrhL